MPSEADKIVGLYQRFAEDWDRERPRGLVEKIWLDRFTALLHPAASILDLGCGSGEPISRYLIENGFVVTGVDSSPALIGMCKARFPNQSWLVADMRMLLLNRRFNGILAWDSFFHLCPEDQERMFTIFSRHATPRAPLMFTSGPLHGEAIGTYKGEPLYHGSLDEDEYRVLLAKHGFDLISHVAEDPSCGYHTVWLARLTETPPGERIQTQLSTGDTPSAAVMPAKGQALRL
jgi:SAM-dependent methyltransferase